MEIKDALRVIIIVDRMKDNSRLWHDADQEKQNELFRENNVLAMQLSTIMDMPVVYDGENGSWCVGSMDGPDLYKLY